MLFELLKPLVGGGVWYEFEYAKRVSGKLKKDIQYNGHKKNDRMTKMIYKGLHNAMQWIIINICRS
jgi:hypothetical protein